MLVPSAVGVVEGLLEQFRPCFSRPQFRNFSAYILGLVACEGRKNIAAINRCFVESKDQSALNRFLIGPLREEGDLPQKRQSV